MRPWVFLFHPSLFILLCLQTSLVSQPENPENAWAVQESKRLVPFGSTTPFGLKPPLSFFHLDKKGFAKQIRLMQRDGDSPQHPGHHQHPLTTILWFSWDHQAQWDFRIWWGVWGLQLRTWVLQVSSLCQSSRSGSNAHAVNSIDGRRLLTCWKLEGFAALIWPAALKLWCRPSAADAACSKERKRVCRMEGVISSWLLRFQLLSLLVMNLLPLPWLCRTGCRTPEENHYFVFTFPVQNCF